MEFLFPLLLTLHILVGLSVIGLVLLQHGKGADMGAAFGSGASGSLFGASGSANFLSRTTAVLASVFFVTSLALSYVASSKPKAPTSVMEAPLTVPVKPSEGAAAGAGVDQKPADTTQQKAPAATEDKPAASTEPKPEAAADDKAQAKAESPPAPATQSKSTPTTDKKDADAAPSKAAAESKAAGSKAKEIPK